MKVYWDSGTRRFMVSPAPDVGTREVTHADSGIHRFLVSQAANVGAREATHAEIKHQLDDALKGWRDLLNAVARALGEPQ